jgi:hypothetical protein
MMLPDFTPVTDVIPAPPEYRLELRGPQKVWPDIQKLDDGRLVLDWWRAADGLAMVRVWRREDHPNMGLLPPNTPRVVKSLFSADGQLKRLRATHCDNSIPSALAAWDMFKRNLKRAA